MEDRLSGTTVLCYAVCAMSVVLYLNTMMCSLWSAPNAVGGVRVLPSRGGEGKYSGRRVGINETRQVEYIERSEG
jgi:hypothetical protein